MGALVFWIAGAILAAGTAWWLTASLQPSTGARLPARLPMTFIMGFVPLAGLLLYLALGGNGRADAPLAERLAGSLDELPAGAVLVRLQSELRARPDDAEGWRLMARLRRSTGAHEQAADAWRRVLELGATDAEAYTGLAQALIETEQGLVGEAAIGLLDAALAAQPDHMAARFWRATAYRQQGETKAATQMFRTLMAELPEAAPLRAMLARELAGLQAETRE